jgi:uncharacterized protein (DUF1778 family)
VPVSEAQKKAKKKWEANNYDMIGIRVKKGNREKIKAFAESQGETLNGFIKRLISSEMNETIE